MAELPKTCFIGKDPLQRQCFKYTLLQVLEWKDGLPNQLQIIDKNEVKDGMQLIVCYLPERLVKCER